MDEWSATCFVVGSSFMVRSENEKEKREEKRGNAVWCVVGVVWMAKGNYTCPPSDTLQDFRQTLYEYTYSTGVAMSILLV